MSSLRTAPRRRETPPPPPDSATHQRIARALAEHGDTAAVARRLRVAQAHVAAVARTLPPPPEPDPAPPPAEWELLSEAIARMIARQGDEAERHHLRLAWLRARHTPYRRTRDG